MNLKRAFLDEVESFLSAHNMGAATFGTKAVKDPNFVFDLRRGRSPNLDLVERVQKFMGEAGGTDRQAKDTAA